MELAKEKLTQTHRYLTNTTRVLVLESTNSRNILATVALLPGITFREHPRHNSI